MAITTSRALIRYGNARSARDLPFTGLLAIYKKYDKDNNFQKRSKVDEYGKSYAENFVNALKEFELLERGVLPNKISNSAFDLYLSINGYFEDIKNDVLDKVTKAVEVLREDAPSQKVKEALNGLRWYQKIADERTREDLATYGAIISRVHIPL